VKNLGGEGRLGSNLKVKIYKGLKSFFEDGAPPRNAPTSYSPPCCPPIIASAELVYLGEAKKICPKRTGKFLSAAAGGRFKT
jgi:hypothetical protein